MVDETVFYLFFAIPNCAVVVVFVNNVDAVVFVDEHFVDFVENLAGIAVVVAFVAVDNVVEVVEFVAVDNVVDKVVVLAAFVVD